MRSVDVGRLLMRIKLSSCGLHHSPYWVSNVLIIIIDHLFLIIIVAMW